MESGEVFDLLDDGGGNWVVFFVFMRLEFGEEDEYQSRYGQS